MKKLRKIGMALAVAFAMVFLAGCYVINAQPMKKVKGTYQLTHYTYTPSYERGKGYTPETINYIEDRGWEVYLVVTGTGEGYYVHKDNETDAYCLKVSLAYEYSEEDTSKVDYVKYQDPLDSGGWNNFAVTKGALNYSRPAFDYTQLFTGKKMRSEDVDKDWKKVSDATDLSYVKSKFTDLKEYTSEEWAMNVVFYPSTVKNVTTNEWVEDPYQYCYIAIDPLEKEAKIYYALKEDLEQKVETASITLVDGWNKIQIGDEEWTKNDGSYTYKRTWTEGEGDEAVAYEVELWQAQREWTENSIAELIQNQMPKVLYEVTNYEDVNDDSAVVGTPYQYYFIALDPGLGNAYTYYALKADMERKFESGKITMLDGWNKIQIGEEEWTNVEGTYTYYRTFTEGEGETAVTYRVELEIVEADWTTDSVEALIQSRLPAAEVTPDEE